MMDPLDRLRALVEALSEFQAAQARAASEMTGQEPQRPRSLQALAERWKTEWAAEIAPQMERLRELRSRIEVLEQLAAVPQCAWLRDGIMAHLEERWGEWDRLVEGLAPDLQRLTSRYPDSPHVEYFETGDVADTGWVRPNRVYLDVTDAPLDEVQKLWPLIMWRHQALRQDGHSAKRSRGNQPGPRTDKVRQWQERAETIGAKEARRQCVAQAGDDPADRIEAGRWFDRVVRPQLKS
jgi:hypothetical protein